MLLMKDGSMEMWNTLNASLSATMLLARMTYSGKRLRARLGGECGRGDSGGAIARVNCSLDPSFRSSPRRPREGPWPEPWWPWWPIAAAAAAALAATCCLTQQRGPHPAPQG